MRKITIIAQKLPKLATAVFLLFSTSMAEESKVNELSEEYKGRLTRWASGDLNRILICPTSTKNPSEKDPFAEIKGNNSLVEEDRQLSMNAFGIIKGASAKQFLSKLKASEALELSSSYQGELYFLFNDLPFSRQDKVRFIYSETELALEFETVSGKSLWFNVGPESRAIFAKNFVPFK